MEDQYKRRVRGTGRKTARSRLRENGMRSKCAWFPFTKCCLSGVKTVTSQGQRLEQTETCEPKHTAVQYTQHGGLMKLLPLISTRMVRGKAQGVTTNRPAMSFEFNSYF